MPSIFFSVFKASKGLNPDQVWGSRGNKRSTKRNTGRICWELSEEFKCILRTQRDEKSLLVGVIFAEELVLILDLRAKRKQSLLIPAHGS